MAKTPERRVKDQVDKVLKADGCYCYMPVPSGYGSRKVLDYIGCSKGRFFAVETKAPGEEPTKLQWLAIEHIRASGGVAFVIEDAFGVEELRLWLATC